MNAKEKRDVALYMVRSYLKSKGVNPETTTAHQAWAALDDLVKIDGWSIAAQFYRHCSEHQVDLFFQDWKKYRLTK